MTVNDTLYQQALHYHRANELSAAEKIYYAVLSQDATHTPSLHGLGLIAAAQQDWPTALQWFLQALVHAPLDATLHNNLGNCYRALKDFEKANYHYQQALQQQPDYPEAYNNLANCYQQQSELTQALTAYIKATQLKPDFIEAHYNLGLLFIQLKEWDHAIKQFQNVLALYPHALGAHQQLGNLYLLKEDWSSANNHFHQVLALDETNADAYSNLGVIALKQQQPQQAIAYFSQALGYDEHHLEARNNIAALFMQHDRFDNAIGHYGILLQLQPNNSEAHYNSGVAHMALGHLKEAIMHFEKVLTENAAHSDALCNLAAIYVRLQKPNRALHYYQQAAHVKPYDSTIQFMLAALTHQTNTFTSAPPTYITQLFDNYASYFEMHLQQLHYKAPQLLRQAIENYLGEKTSTAYAQWNILDLGCGTGLVANAFRRFAKHLVGVDISPKMLEEAKKKSLYDELIHRDMELFLQESTYHFDLIVAADVFCYIGDLKPILAACLDHLEPNGLIAFTLEKNTQNKMDFYLQPTARFVHHPDYITRLATTLGFNVELLETVQLRKQEQQPVDSLLILLSTNHSSFSQD